MRMEELVCDGALVCTPAAGIDRLQLFRAWSDFAHWLGRAGADGDGGVSAPAAWRGALLPKNAVVRFDVLDHDKRPVMADADSRSVENVVSVEIRSDPEIGHRLLFDPVTGWKSG